MKKSDGVTKLRDGNWRVRYLRAFGRDEDGSIIILTILLLIIMLVLGGMAVDFMRYEARRAALQSVSDRAVLAAANLNQTVNSRAVVEDYFAKAGFTSAIVGTPTVVDGGNSRTVSVTSQVDVNTFYLRLIGIDTLQAPARSSATEGVGKVEISLVLDVSGSMRWGGSRGEAAGGRFLDMRDAAIAFADKVLDPSNGG
jgi:Flp pilus assembly protein TadG